MNGVRATLFCSLCQLYSHDAYAVDCDAANAPQQPDKAGCGYMYDPQYVNYINELYQRQTVMKYHQLSWQLDLTPYNDFWTAWGEELADSPWFTDQQATTYYGFGLWMPEKYKEDDVGSLSDASSWLLNHGLQMSVGFGDMGASTPRIRVDYRWHNDKHVDDGVSLQFHIPFE